MMQAVDERKSGLQNLTAEASLLGCLIANPDALDQVTEHIGAGDFANPRNSAIYSAVCMAAIEDTTGLSAIIEQLRKDGALSHISENYLHQLVGVACSTDEIRQTVAIILDLARKREKVAAATSIIDSVTNGHDETIAFDRLLDAQDRQVTNGDGFADLEGTMKQIISGNYKKTEPTILRRSDGEFLLYAGKLNWLSAPPEAMKSFTALLASVQMMQEGKPVVYVDFEDDASTICERLYKVAVGQQLESAEELVMTWTSGPLYADGSRDRSRALFHYIAAGRAFDMKMRSLVLKAIKNGAQLVTIDGCATALAHANLDENSNSDVNTWISAVSYPLTSAGAAVLIIDHVTKSSAPSLGGSSARYARGAGSKLAAVSGAALSFDVKEAGSVHTEARIEISVSKDRPGRIHVSKRSGKRIAGVLISQPMTGGREGVKLVVHPVEEISQLAEQKRFDLVAAEHIYKLLQEVGPATKTGVNDLLKERAKSKGTKGFRTETLVAATKFLIDNGYVRCEKEGRFDNLYPLTEYKSSYGDIHADDVKESPF
jgi:hypothetical protein